MRWYLSQFAGVIFLVAVVCVVVLVAVPALAADRQPWYIKDHKPTTLKRALEEEKKFLGEKNIGYRMKLPSSLCSLYEEVGLACDYNTRRTLSMFLTIYGNGLFPTLGKTNPYIGTAKQNEMLLFSVRRNARLFKNGDLAAEDIKHWR